MVLRLRMGVVGKKKWEERSLGEGKAKILYLIEVGSKPHPIKSNIDLSAKTEIGL